MLRIALLTIAAAALSVSFAASAETGHGAHSGRVGVVSPTVPHRNGMERPSLKTHRGHYLSRPLVQIRPSPLIKGPQPLFVIAGDDPRP
jgi:hypothetical protein